MLDFPSLLVSRCLEVERIISFYSFDNHMTKRGYQMCSLTTSYIECSKLLIFCIPHVLLTLGGSLCEDLDIIVSFQMSPRSLRT